MHSKKYCFLVALTLLAAFVLRVIPLFGNSFYFTMDQGNDAVKAREIWAGHRPTLLGPESSIFGIFAGPLWYYFISIGYLLSGGNPAGPVVLMIALNVFLTFLIIRKISIEVSPKVGILVGAMLQISWWFYDSSRYAFNPFPDTFLIFLAIFFLIDFLKGDKKKYIWAAVPFGLFFHTDLASAVAVNIFYFGFGLLFLKSGRIKLKSFIIANVVILLFLTPHIVSEFLTGFSQINALIKELNNPHGAFAGGQITQVSQKMFMLVSRSILRQVWEVGFLGFVIVVAILISKSRTKRVNHFIKHFVLISISLLIISWIFFATNKGWRDWQTSFLSPIIFVSSLLALVELPVLLSLPILLVSIFSHFEIFNTRYQEYLLPNNDPSLLVNEIKVIDWAYSQANNKSLSVYVWIPSVFDYHYQYLFWWYGKNKYGFFPCEVNTFPDYPKTYMPRNYEEFEKQKGNCPAKTIVLIMEPDKNGQIDQSWYRDITANTDKVAQTNIGALRLEKLILP